METALGSATHRPERARTQALHSSASRWSMQIGHSAAGTGDLPVQKGENKTDNDKENSL